MSEIMQQHERWQAARERMGANVTSRRHAKGPVEAVVDRIALFRKAVDAAWPDQAEPVFYDCFVPADMSSTRAILIAVCAKHHTSPRDLKSAARNQPLSRARAEAFYELRQNTKLSFAQIGRLMGGFDHSSVLKGCAVHRERIARGEA